MMRPGRGNESRPDRASDREPAADRPLYPSGQPNRAKTFVAELEDRCIRLAATPYAYPLIPGREHSRIRRRLHRNYLIFYRVSPQVNLIEVLYIINGAQDYEAILFPQD